MDRTWQFLSGRGNAAPGVTCPARNGLVRRTRNVITSEIVKTRCSATQGHAGRYLPTRAIGFGELVAFAFPGIISSFTSFRLRKNSPTLQIGDGCGTYSDFTGTPDY